MFAVASRSNPRKTLRCPICRTPIRSRSEEPHFPFCSARCKLVDLGRWLREEYVISEPLPEAQAGEDDRDEAPVH